MRMKSITFLLIVFICLLALTSCGKSPSTTDNSNHQTVQTPAGQGSDGGSSDSDLVSLLKQDNLKMSKDLISQFFWYYRLNIYELSILPAFISPEQANWDQFSLYIYMNFVRPRNEAKYENYDEALTKENFAVTVNKYFGEIKYADRGSLYLDYVDGIYFIKPGDPGKHGYYRLVDIRKDTNGIYTAVFDGLFFGELEYSDPYKEATPNIKAIRDAAGTTEAMQKTEFEKTVIDIFLEPNYSEILSMNERVTIQFTLSGDNIFPFVYKSCRITNY